MSYEDLFRMVGLTSDHCGNEEIKGGHGRSLYNFKWF